MKLCITRSLVILILFFTALDLSAQTLPTHYFRSLTSGNWNTATTWESSPDGSSNWVTSTLVPTEVANTITIRNTHTVAITGNTTIDQVVILSGGILDLATAVSTFLTVNDGAGNDVIVQSGGVLKHSIAGSQLPQFLGAATLEIQNNGVLEVVTNNGTPSNYANNGSTISANLLWADSSIFNWNNATSPANGITYFPPGTAIPIFRVSKAISFGNTNPTVINGLLEANANVSLQSTGAKTFRNGIVGTASVSATAINGGQIVISGATAKLGGGNLTLNNSGLSIGAGTVATLVSNKTINNFPTGTGTTTLLGTFIAGDFIVSGDSKILINGILKTTNANGLTGSLNSTFATGFNISSFSISSTTEYNRIGDQTITPLSYGNLNISGTGLKKVTALADVSVSGALNISSPNTFALNGTNDLKLNGGGSLNINAVSFFDSGGESQVTGGGSPTINIYGTFICRDANGFTGTSTSIPGATTTVNIYSGSIIEFGRLGDQQVSARDDYKNVTFSGSGTKTLPTCSPFGTVTIKDNVVVDASNKTFGDANTNLIMASGKLIVAGNGTKPDMDGAYNLTGGDIEFTNSGTTAQAIRSPKNYFNIIISGSNVKNGAGIITLVTGGSFTIKNAGIYDNNATRIDGNVGTQSFVMEAGATFKTGVPAGLSGNGSEAIADIETINIDPKSIIVYSRTDNQTITTLQNGYPTLLLKGSGVKTVTSGTMNISTSADSVVIDPLVVFKVSAGAKANFNNRPVIIHSNATGTGAIGEVTDGSIALLNTANITVERFIPAKRAFRLLSSPVTASSSIKANWMEGQSNTAPAYSVNYNSIPGYGTHITGSANANTGFDATATNNPSLFTFNNTGQVWNAATNTNSTLVAGIGYRLLVRGSRSVDLSNNSALPSNTTLRTTGSLIKGPVTYNGSTTPSIDGNTNSYSLVGNPYASAVDWDLLAKSGLSSYYYAWDPNLNTRGAYVTYGNGVTSVQGSQVNQNIQSGQAFFIQTKTANPSLTFNETNKTITNRNVFRTSADVQTLSVQLLLDTLSESEHTADGVTILFNDDFSSSINAEDAEKISNLDENISVTSNGRSLSIEGRPAITSPDTVRLDITQLRQKSYFLKISPSYFHPTVTAIIKDNYLKKDSLIDLTTETIIPFIIDSDPASFLSNRFMLVFKTSKILPLVLTDVKAYKKENGIQVEWSTQTEKGVEKYEIEKSVNGQLFEKVQTVTAKNNSRLQNNYAWLDANPISGNNFYRIRCIQQNGEPFYTKQVVVSIEKTSRLTAVFPNPVKGNSINLSMRNLERGNYTIALINSLGETVLTQTIKYNGTTEQYKINIGKVFSKGNYSLTITNGSDIFINRVIID
ncbi:T9SS type A sorting domain-containing protein [Segetibacter aerophilus]|uniref:Secretion system C-terminal sorting domain-containing protein n=1 Tax=Segetibacter aerophilus TaxID=670293 RepID=A0A512BEV1_9BACT|nr:T9SS type A sorting domain-containing protein [Segetibacter aerophilus]GEO10357.1 hypothetical protein SAE01_28530 [Segetibacter aerophilus]